MKTRLKLLAAGGVFLMALTLKPSPAVAICRAPAIDGIYSEAACASYCWSGGCYSYEYFEPSCFCS